MVRRDAKCVFVSNELSEAAVVANWLQHQGIPAEVVDNLTRAGMEGRTGLTGSSSRGREVWVVQSEDAERAKALLEEREKEVARTGKNVVLGYCNSCGEATEVDLSQLTNAPTCPECKGPLFIDQELDEFHEQPAGDSSFEQTKKSQKPLVLTCLVILGLVLGIAVVGSIFF